jgi:uncharacterized protein DUF4190
MSQYPPPPPGQQPPYPPQPGMPPGQAPYPPQPGMPGAYHMQPTKGNGFALASLITGIVGFCVPFLGGLLAILFGFLGLRRSKETHSGKGLAIAGLILGVLSLGFYALFGGAVVALIKGTEVNRTVAHQFIRDLSAGNVTSAQSATDSSINSTELEDLSGTVKGFGAVQDITVVSTVVKNGNAELAGIVKFSGNSTKAFEMRQKKVGDQWKVTYFRFQ